MRRRILLFGVGLWLVAVCPNLPGQEAACEATRHVLPVNVLDKDGNQVWGLTARDFRAEFRGQPVRVVSVEQDTGPRRVVILLDASGSMERPWKHARRLAEDAIARAPTNVSPGLLVFSVETLAEARVGESVEEMVTMLRELPRGSGGKTGLYDAILRAGQRLAGTRFGEVLYIISDGVDNSSHASLKSVEQMLLAGGTRVFFLLIVPLPAPGRDPNFAYFARDTSYMVERTGGTGLVFPHRLPPGVPITSTITYDMSSKEEAQFMSLLRSLYLVMAEAYRLEVELAGEVDKPRDWKLEVVDARGKRRKDLMVHYPRKLVPCSKN